MQIENLDIAIVTSSFEHIEKLNRRIYHEIEREGYHNLVTETKDGIQQSLTIFKNIGNPDLLNILLRGYEYLNDSTIYYGKVLRLERYIAKEYSGSPMRIKVTTDILQEFDLPLIALEHLGITIN